VPNARGAAAARAAADGRRGAATRRDERRGRLVGVRPDAPRGGRRLALVDTLRAAVPWQRARGRVDGAPLAVRAGDLRVERRRRPTGTTTVVVVDASGSAALGRLAEAKGAVELLLAESYARRDRVALVAFRGARADVLLPPTRALARARRAVGGLPAGGGTPLAAALVTAAGLAGAARREGARPAVVLLTDGRANVALDGTPGRARAREEALGAARALAAALAAAGGLAVLVDTGARAGRGAADPEAADLARALGARRVALPHVDARALHAQVREALDDRPAGGAA
jgi:magnesium chelatase subunit D